MQTENLIDGRYTFTDLIDNEGLELVFEKFSKATNFTVGLVDNNTLDVLIKTGWHSICLNFHRADMKACEVCKRSNKALFANLEQLKAVRILKCTHGLYDCATPIIIEGKHVANLVTGQLLMEEPDIEQFERNAEIYGFDKKKYIEALREVPIVSREEVESILDYLAEFAAYIAKMGLNKFRTAEINKTLQWRNEEYVALNEEYYAQNEELIEMQKIDRVNRNNLQSLFNAMNDIVFEMDYDGRYVFIAPTSPELLVRPTDDTVGKTLHDIFPKPVADLFLQFVRKCLDEKKTNTIEYPLEIDGKMLWFEGRATPKTESTILYIARNITSRRLVEEELKKQNNEYASLNEEYKAQNDELIVSKRKTEKSREQFRAIFEQSPISIQIFDKTGLTVSANKAWEELWLTSRTDILQKYNVLEDTYAEETGWLAHIRRAFEGEIVFLPDLEYDPVESGYVGRKRILKCIAFPLILKGEVEQVILMHQDVTDLKKYEVDLILAKEKAEESDRLKTEFINNLSHEIRTPMNGILGFSDFLNDSNLTDDKRKYFVSIIQNSGKQLLRIIDDILEISKLETKQVKTFQTKICLNDLLLGLFSIFDLKAKENKVPLYLKKGLPDDACVVVTDETKLVKIVGNLLDNALKFTDEGFIEFGYKLKEQMIEIYVKDTGIGIASDKLEMIFERFSQAERTLTQKTGGLGLGLSIAKENAELIGGRIHVKSKMGEGTTFYLILPYSADNQNVNSYFEGLNDPKHVVLVVEDEELNYLFLETLLESFDMQFTILHAKNGDEAIDICQIQPEVELVLMDLKLPIIDGYEATREIKKARPNLPIVAQTAYSSQADKERATEAGCDDFITKPIRKKRLQELLNRYLIIE